MTRQHVIVDTSHVRGSLQRCVNNGFAMDLTNIYLVDADLLVRIAS
jgi:hypothetical protein